MKTHPVVQLFNEGLISSNEAFRRLALELASCQKTNTLRAFVEEAISQVLGIPAEPADETEGKSKYNSYMKDNVGQQ